MDFLDHDRWLYAFKNLHRLKDHPKELEAGIFKRLIEIAELAKFAPLEQQDYQESLKDYWDLKSSMDTYYEEGKADEKREIVRNGLKQGLDIPLIATLTGLSRNVIEQIRDGK